MKKTIIAALAILLFSACVQEKIDTPPTSKAISFAPSFTAFATRSDNNIDFDTFFVWGYQTDSNDNTICIFNGTPVSYNQTSGNWEYDLDFEDDDITGTRYWMPNCEYDFYAFAPSKSGLVNIVSAAKNQPPTIILESWGMLPQEDYVYAKYHHKKTDSTTGSVVFEFEHLLTKVSMSFTNNIHPYIKASVSNIKITIPQAGTITINGDNTSVSTSQNQVFSFDEDIVLLPDPNQENPEETDAILLYPNSNDFKYDIQFDITLTVHNDIPEALDGEIITGTTTITGSLNKALQMGIAYKLSTILTPEVIKSGNADFSVEEIEGWGSATGEQQISIASRFGGEVTLVEDVTISSPIDVVNDLTINLNGHTITYIGENTMFDVKNSSTLTINSTDANGSHKNNSSLKSPNDVYLAKATENSTIIIAGGSHETSSSKLYTSDSESTIIVNAGDFHLWNPEMYIVYLPHVTEINIVQNDEWYYIKWKVGVDKDNEDNSPLDQIMDAFQTPYIEEVIIPDDCDLNNLGNSLYVNHDMTITGKSSSSDITTGSGANRLYGILINGPYTVTIKNVDIIGGGVVAQDGANVTLENCSITTTYSSSGRHVCFVANSTLTIKNCNLTVTVASGTNYIYANNGTILIEVNDIDGYKKGIFSGSNRSFSFVGTTTATIKGGTYNFDPTSWVNTEIYKVTKSGSNYTVTLK